jgi:hypothetical protein
MAKSPKATEEELSRFIEDAAARLEGALADNFTGRIESSVDHPAAQRLARAADRLLAAARQVGVRAEAIARDRDALDIELAEVHARLADEISARERLGRPRACERPT